MLQILPAPFRETKYLRQPTDVRMPKFLIGKQYTIFSKQARGERCCFP